MEPFVEAYRAGQRGQRAETENFKRYTYDELAARPGFNLDIWADIKDDSLSDPSSLPAPEVIAAQIVEDATAAIEAFAAVAAELAARNGTGASSETERDAVEVLLPDEPIAQSATSAPK